MKRWLLVLMLLISAGPAITAGDDEQPVPEPDIYGHPPTCC